MLSVLRHQTHLIDVDVVGSVQVCVCVRLYVFRGRRALSVFSSIRLACIGFRRYTWFLVLPGFGPPQSPAPALLLCDLGQVGHHHADGCVGRRAECRRVVGVRDRAGAVQGSPGSLGPPPVHRRTVLRPAVWTSRPQRAITEQTSASQILTVVWIGRVVSDHAPIAGGILRGVWSPGFVIQKLEAGFLPSICEQIENMWPCQILDQRFTNFISHISTVHSL